MSKVQKIKRNGSKNGKRSEIFVKMYIKQIYLNIYVYVYIIDSTGTLFICCYPFSNLID